MRRNSMQKAKSRTLTTFVIAILAFSMVLAATPMAKAATSVTLRKPDDSSDLTSGPVGTKVLVKGSIGTAFGPFEVYWDGYTKKIAEGYAKVDKSYAINITIPEDVAGVHYVIVKDTTEGSSSYAEFIITSKIVLKPDKALPGDLITVTGTGFTGEVAVKIYFGTLTPVSPTESVTLSGSDVGPYSGTLTHKPVVIKSVTITVTIDDSNMEMTDNGAGGLTSTDTRFDSGTINYATGVFTFKLKTAPGAAPTLAQAQYTYAQYEVTPAAGVKTSKLGSFTAVINIPAIQENNYGDYDVTAVDAKGNSAIGTITVDYYVLAEPESGPPGIKVDVSGRIEPNKDVEVKFGKDVSFVTAFVTTSDANGYFSGEYTLPLLLVPGLDYKFVAYWDTKSRYVSFEVKSPPTITLEPESARAGENVTITGLCFCSEANVTIYFGATKVATATTDEEGAFGAEFTVPSVAAGTYKVKAVDEYGATAEAYFTVKPPAVIVIQPRATQYMQGDTISFYINTTTRFDDDRVTITVKDPSGYIFWVVEWTLEETPSGSGIYIVPYEDQLTGNGVPLTLPTDAPVGSWNWTATYKIGGKDKKATGLFTVVAKLSLQAVIDRLDELDAKLVAINGSTAVIQTNLGAIEVKLDNSTAEILAQLNAMNSGLAGKLDALSKQVSGLSDSVGSMSATVGSIKDALTLGVTSIRNDISSVKGDLAALSDSMSKGFSNVNSALGTLTSSVGKLGDIPGQITSLGNTLSKSISDNANSIQASIANAQSSVTASMESSISSISTYLIIIGILAAITLVIEAAILMRRLS
jgi:hypothetical protein